jgi:hypothetical protein
MAATIPSGRVNPIHSAIEDQVNDGNATAIDLRPQAPRAIDLAHPTGLQVTVYE